MVYNTVPYIFTWTVSDSEVNCLVLGACWGCLCDGRGETSHGCKEAESRKELIACVSVGLWDYRGKYRANPSDSWLSKKDDLLTGECYFTSSASGGAYCSVCKIVMTLAIQKPHYREWLLNIKKSENGKDLHGSSHRSCCHCLKWLVTIPFLGITVFLFSKDIANLEVKEWGQ